MFCVVCYFPLLCLFVVVCVVDVQSSPSFPSCRCSGDISMQMIN